MAARSSTIRFSTTALISLPGNCKPNVSIGDKTHQGLPSNDVIVRNNIANGFGVFNANPQHNNGSQHLRQH